MKQDRYEWVCLQYIHSNLLNTINALAVLILDHYVFSVHFTSIPSATSLQKK